MGTEGERETDRNREKHVTQGYNIIADRGTGASNPHPHPNPHTQASRPLVFPLFHSDGQMDQQTGRWTNRQSLWSWNETDLAARMHNYEKSNYHLGHFKVQIYF